MKKFIQIGFLIIVAFTIITCTKEKDDSAVTPQTYRTINLTDSIYPRDGGSGSGWVSMNNIKRYYSDLQKYDENYKDRISCIVVKTDSNAIVPGTYPTVSPEMDLLDRNTLTASVYFTLDSIQYNLLAGQNIQIQKVNDNYSITFQNCKAYSKQKSETVNVNASIEY